MVQRWFHVLCCFYFRCSAAHFVPGPGFIGCATYPVRIYIFAVSIHRSARRWAKSIARSRLSRLAIVLSLFPVVLLWPHVRSPCNMQCLACGVAFVCRHSSRALSTDIFEFSEANIGQQRPPHHSVSGIRYDTLDYVATYTCTPGVWCM